MELKGLTVAITGSRRASELAHLIENFGGVPYVAPTVGIAVQEDVDLQVEGLVRKLVSEDMDYAVFMTGPGVYRLMSTAERLALAQECAESLNRTCVVARSHKPQKVLEGYGVRVSLVPSDNTAEGIAREMAKFDLRNKSVTLLWPGTSEPILRETLERGGAKVFEAMAYGYSLELEKGGADVLAAVGFKSIPPEERKILQLINDLLKGAIHIITFTSPPSARNLFHVAEGHGLHDDLRRSLNEKVLIAAIGPPTRRAIEEHGVAVDVVPDAYKLGSMVRAIGDFLAQRLSSTRKTGLAAIHSAIAGEESG